MPIAVAIKIYGNSKINTASKKIMITKITMIIVLPPETPVVKPSAQTTNLKNL
jgi:hypothetical protein